MQTEQPTLSFSIPGAPDDAFISQIAMFRLALNALGGVYHAAEVVAFLGDRFNSPIPRRWLPYLDNVNILRASTVDFERESYKAQGDMRWRCEPTSKYVIQCDADTIVLKPFDDLLQNLDEKPAVGGVIAYAALPVQRWKNPEKVWMKMAHELINKPIELAYPITLSNSRLRNSNTKTPFYPNFGFIILPKDYYTKIAQSYFDLRSKIVNYVRKQDFSGQAALTLAIEAHGLNKQALPVKYNYVNSKTVDQRYPDDMSDIRVLHYLNTDHFDRHKIFASAKEFDRFLNLSLKGSNAVFQERILQLTGGNYPFI